MATNRALSSLDDNRMPEPTPTQRKNISPDWFVQGILTKIGDTFDRLLGRGWKPSSSLATSELVERLKDLLDAEVTETESKGKFVPHNIKLKIQWDKFSTDSDKALTQLENELLTAAVDHINDRRYYTYAPLSIEVKPDYFTSGVKLYASFEAFEDDRETEVNVSMPGVRLNNVVEENTTPRRTAKLSASFTARNGQTVRTLVLTEGERVSIGRTNENNITIDDVSVSKIHASLLLGSAGNLVVADTGSTNGTFINDERLAYGKAVEIARTDLVKFGVVAVQLELVLNELPVSDTEDSDKYTFGEFEFLTKTAEGIPTSATSLSDKPTLPETSPAPEPPPDANVFDSEKNK